MEPERMPMATTSSPERLKAKSRKETCRSPLTVESTPLCFPDISPEQVQAKEIVVAAEPEEAIEPVNFVEIIDEAWKLRADRNKVNEEKLSTLRRLLKVVAPDLAFALGKYSGGSLKGKPKSIYAMAGNSEHEELVSRRDSNASKTGDVETLKRTVKIWNKIKGNCNMAAVRMLGWFLSKFWRLCFNSICVNQAALERMREDLIQAGKQGNGAMLLPTHRSHIDYLLLSYICFGFNLPVPHIAAGNNLNIPVIGPMFSAAGAFFMRREFKGDDLYKKVFSDYLLQSLKLGSPVECFIEGGRTRTGTISDPKLGLVAMVTRFVAEKKIKDVVLFPISLDYDRVLESEGYSDHLLGQVKANETFFGTLQSGAALLNTPKHGKVFVNFAQKISVAEVITQVDEKMKCTNRVPKISDYTVAVGKKAVTEQRSCSTISYTNVVACVLLACSDDDWRNPAIRDIIFERLEWLLQLLQISGTKVEKDSNTESVQLLEDAMKVLSPVFDAVKRYERPSFLRWISSLLSRNKETPREQETERARLIAKMRLRLRYSCGQLTVEMAAISVISCAIQASIHSQGLATSSILTAEVLHKAEDIAQLVACHLPGANLSLKRLKRMLETTCNSLGLKIRGDRIVDVNREDLEARLRVPFVLIAPSMNASFALLSTLLPLLNDSIRVTEKELVELCRDALYDQFDMVSNESRFLSSSSKSDGDVESNDSDSTDLFSHDEGEADVMFGIGLTEIASSDDIAVVTEEEGLNELQEMLSTFGIPYPEALSSKEIRGAIKYLVNTKVLDKYDEPYIYTVSNTTTNSRLISTIDNIPAVSSMMHLRNLSEITSTASMAELQAAPKSVDGKSIRNLPGPFFEISLAQKRGNGQLMWRELSLLKSYREHFQSVGVSPKAVVAGLKLAERETKKQKVSLKLRQLMTPYTLLVAYTLSKVWKLKKKYKIKLLS